MAKEKADKAAKDQKPLERLSFEEALARLEETVRTLENGSLPLEEATRLFEEGMKLARLCSEHLYRAELKVSQIQTSYGEQMRMLAEEQSGPPEE